jgi:hypothetical protein
MTFEKPYVTFLSHSCAQARSEFGAAALPGGAPSVVPLPPRRPDFLAIAVAPPAAAASKLIDGAQPILDASRFAPAAFSPQAQIDNEKSGG